MNNTLIGIGHRNSTGKTTTANYMKLEYGFAMIEMSYFIRRDFINNNIQNLFAYENKSPEEEITKEQLLKWGQRRRSENINYWANILDNTLYFFFKICNTSMVVSGIRFITDVNVINRYNGILINVKRDKKIIEDNRDIDNVSENELNSFTGWNFSLDNNGEIDVLYKQIDDMMNNIGISKTKKEI